MGRLLLSLWGWGLLLATMAAATESTEETKEEVKWSAFEHVGRADFEKTLEERDYNIVAFVNSNNFDSEMLEWEWPAIKEKETNLLSVDCEAEQDLCFEHDVRHYPTVRAYKTGKMFARYRGPRRAGPLLNFARRTRLPVVGGLDSTNLTSFASTDDVNFILHLRAEDAGKGLYKRFHNLAEEFHDRYSFAVISRDDDNSVDEEGENAPSVLRCYNNVEGIQKSLVHFFDSTVGLRNFVMSCVRQLVQPMNRLNVQGYTEGENAVLYYFDSEIPAREAFSEKMRPVAKTYADHIQIVTVDPLTFPEVVNKMTLKWEFPAMAIQVPAEKTISLYSHGDIDAEIVEKFIKDILHLNPPEEITEDQPPVDEGVVLEDSEEEAKPEGEADTKAEEKHDEL